MSGFLEDPVSGKLVQTVAVSKEYPVKVLFLKVFDDIQPVTGLHIVGNFRMAVVPEKCFSGHTDTDEFSVVL